jgi:hypothetical protein
MRATRRPPEVTKLFVDGFVVGREWRNENERALERRCVDWETIQFGGKSGLSASSFKRDADVYPVAVSRPAFRTNVKRYFALLRRLLTTPHRAGVCVCTH